MNLENEQNNKVISLDGDCPDCQDFSVLQKGLSYELIKETKKEKKTRIDNWETAKNKKIWLGTYFDHVGSSYETICVKTSIPRRTFNYWKKNDKKFRDDIFSVKENRVEVWEDRIVLAGMQGNVPALKFLLENNHPKYSKRIKVETYTGDKTLEDLIDEDEEQLNKPTNDNNNAEKKEVEPLDDRKLVEDKEQEGENSTV